MSVFLGVGDRIHVTHSTSGLEFSNISEMPCRVALVTGEPSPVTGMVPVYVFPPYTSPYGGQLDPDHADRWHPINTCHRDIARKLDMSTLVQVGELHGG